MESPDHGRRLRLSASSLARFDLCRRRFYLQDLRALRWPAPSSTGGRSQDDSKDRGRRFHELVERAALGVDPLAAIEAAGDPSLSRWWRDFVAHAPRPGSTVLHELELSAPLEGVQLCARLDRLERDGEGRVIISDWKTGRHAWDAGRLAENWQTCLYRYLVVEAAGDGLESDSIEPSSVVMRYWHVDRPRDPIEIAYDAPAHEAARERLRDRIAEIVGGGMDRDREDFPKTERRERCRTCGFQTYCGRGVGDVAGGERPGVPVESADDWNEIDTDVDSSGASREVEGWERGIDAAAP